VARPLTAGAIALAALTSALSPQPARVTEPLPVADALLRRQWSASWIAAPGAPERDAGVFHFRKVVDFPEAPSHLVVHVSADNRYILHVNGQRVGAGPARGDVWHWPFETYDLAPFLRGGRNVVAATVWNFGTLSPMAQMSRRTGFLLQEDQGTGGLDTGSSWQAEIERGHAPNPDAVRPLRSRHYYYAAGPGERRDGRLYDWQWDAIDSPDTRWVAASVIMRAHPRSIREGPAWMMSPEGWLLVPSALPPMQHSPDHVGVVVRTGGISGVRDRLAEPVLVPARTDAHLLFDRGEMLNAYPAIVVSGGRDATIRLTYAEALYDAKGLKGNRNDIAGKEIVGLYDEFVADGGSARVFEPLWFRTWRFLDVEVRTADEPLTIDGVRATRTGFPLDQRARFDSDDPVLSQIWETGWRTARLAAHETYMDAPYWEQLQYIGDTRIDALITYAVTGDARLPRRAIELFDQSRLADGITQSRYPTAELQYIPPYALFFVSMVHDYWMYVDDEAFVRARLPGTRSVLDWFLDRQRADGFLGFLPFWVHGDTGTALDDAIQDEDGGSGVITIQFLATLREAAEIEETLGDVSRAARYRQAAARAAAAVRQLWDDSRGLMADTPRRRSWGHPVNIVALLHDVVPAEGRARALRNVLTIAQHPAGRSASGERGGAWPLADIPSASLYFRFHLSRMLEATGSGDEYVPLLRPWRDMLALGLTTWAEHPEPTRSDCHAWSAHPTLDLLRIVGGIRPAAPGFSRVRIAPALGQLERVTVTHPHPRGDLRATYRREGTGLRAEITLPPGVSGEFVWQGTQRALHEGTQVITVR
jgi:alpha-L-rhamnosidase